MKLPSEYNDGSGGLRPAPLKESFNNIVHSTHYIAGYIHHNNLSMESIEEYVSHIKLNTDKNGLYFPKNSHDNIFYKIIGIKLLKSNLILSNFQEMDMPTAMKEIGFYRLWDMIMLMFTIGSPIMKFISRFFLWIPALQMIEACANSGKIRPLWFEKNPNLSRIKWWFKSKKLIKQVDDGSIVTKHWKLSNGQIKKSRHMVNDGKHLAVFKLYAFRDDSVTLYLTSLICKYLLKKKYGKDYVYNMLKRWYLDSNNPAVKSMKHTEDFL